MTVEVQDPFNEHTANGVATVFAYEFRVIVASHLVVKVDGATIPDSDYTVSGVGDANGGTVTFDTAPASGAAVLLSREVPLSRSQNYTTNGPFPAATVNQEFDLIWMVLQKLRADYAGVLRVPYPDTVDETPTLTDLRGRLLGFHADTGQPQASTFTMTQVASVIAAIYVAAAGPLDALSYIQDAIDAVSMSAQERIRGISFTPEEFYESGDTNDTESFARMSAAVNAAGGGTIRLKHGKNYTVGKQTFAGATGLGYAYLGVDIISISNCTKPVVIEGNGARLKLANGLKFGSFDPVTGLAHVPGALPFTNADYIAHVNEMIELYNNASVTIRDLELDGNIQNISLGGQWGDTGYQCAGYGIWAYNNKQLLVENVHTHHHALDGIAIGYAGLTSKVDRFPHTLINVRSLYNARQGLTWTGGNSLTAISCKFNYTGKSTFSSSPASGVDIEAESGAWCQGGHFINCEMFDNTNKAVVADSGTSMDMLFDNCLMLSTTGQTLWPNKPGYTFRNCRIYGQIIAQYGSANDSLRAKFIDCYISDESLNGAVPYITAGILLPSALGGAVLYERCRFRTTRSKPGRFDFAIVKGCMFLHEAGTEVIADQDWLIQGGGGWWEDNTFDTGITNAPATGYTLMVASGTEVFRGKNYLVNSGAGVARWNSYSVAGGGYEGYYGESYGFGAPAFRVPQHALTLSVDARRDAFVGAQNHYAANGAVPAGVTVQQGDIFWNAACAAGGIPGWIVTVTGVTGSTAVTKAMPAVAA